jgi:virginiamycin B lyase
MVVLLTFGNFIESAEMAFADETCDLKLNTICDFVVEYPKKSSIKPPSPSGSTHEIAFQAKDKESRDGKLWITGQNYDQLVAIDINKLKEGEKAFSFYQLPQKSGPHGIVFDEQGNLWVALEFAGKVIRLDPAKLNSVRPIEYGDPAIIEDHDVGLYGCTKNKQGETFVHCTSEEINTNPHGLAINNHDHTVWYTGKATGTLGRIKDGKVESFPISKVNNPKAIVGSVPIYIQADSQGNIWFTELVGNAIGLIKKDEIVAKEFKISTPNSRPIMIVEEPGHKNMWFTEEAGNKVGRITPDGSISEFSMPKPQDNVILAGLAFDSDKNLWVQQYVRQDVNVDQTCQFGYDYLVKIDKKILESSPSDIDNISFEFYKVPTCGTVMHRINPGPDGNLWFTELKTDKVGVLSLTKGESVASR